MGYGIGVISTIVGLALSSGTQVFVQSKPDPAPILAPGTKTRPVQLGKVVIKLTRGTPYGRTKAGLLCLPAGVLTWKGGSKRLDNEDFDAVFKDEIGQLGFDVVSSTGNMFDPDDGNARAEYLVGGTITSMTIDACFPQSGLGDVSTAKGSATMEVEWQIYNRLERKVVDTIVVRTETRQRKAQAGGAESLLFSAFAKNVKALGASGKLQQRLVGEPTDLTVARVASPKFPRLRLALVTGSTLKLPEAAGSTVLVQSGNAHGSGFLISTDGYFLTNHHVVAGATYVKLRWPDGLEGLGEVIRSDRGRDVALIKGDARSRAPIALRTAPLPVGSAVYAIGAPFEKAMQSTVTRGIVSAYRVMDGYGYIQSDASVGPGNSGGPLLDDESRLVGMTVSGVRINDAPQGVNFFIPAADALAFLALDRAEK